MANFTKHLLFIGVLTLFTQIGGALWALFLPIYFWMKKRTPSKWKARVTGLFSFVILYTLISAFVVPPLAKWQCGRVPLPVFDNPNLKSHHLAYFCLLNHHYVRPQVKESMEKAALLLAKTYPGTKVYYLDANFPFFDGYPLQPHFTHRNGTTVDIALHWQNGKTGQANDGAPTGLAYGYSAVPKPGEVDMEEKCDNPFRSIEMKISNRFRNMKDYQLDEPCTAEMIRMFCQDKSVKKILLEPHLKIRLGLARFDKIRFQGCKAARHDDHIHVIW